jgi:hypothetical protein
MKKLTDKKEVTYIVCWVKEGKQKGHLLSTPDKDKYEVFIDDYDGAKAKYDKLLTKDRTHSVSICEVVESSDYPAIKPYIEREYSLCEAVADIAAQVAARRFISTDSRMVISLIIQWANEFEAANEGADWGVDTELDYIEAIDQFTDIKIRDAIDKEFGYIDSDNH